MKLKGGRLFNRQLGRQRTFQNLVDVRCCPIAHQRDVGSIRNQAAGFDKLSCLVHGPASRFSATNCTIWWRAKLNEASESTIRASGLSALRTSNACVRAPTPGIMTADTRSPSLS